MRALGAVFLVLLGAAAAEVSQITGSLLVFALLVMPAATAQVLTARPALSLALTVLIGLAVTWIALAVAYFTPYPIGFYVTTFAFAAYLAAHLARRVRRTSRTLAAGRRMSLFDHPFMVHALLAGTGIALACGLVGYFLVLRAQVFTGDALSHVAFTGALAALAFGIDLRLGLFAATVLIALLLGALGERGRADDVVIGNVFAWILGLGVFFLTLYTTNQSGSSNSSGNETVNVLFGSIFGLSAGQAAVALGIGLGVGLVLLLIARPLLFATLDEAVAQARGVPVRLLGYGFLVLIGVTAGEASQAVGSMLLLGLLAAPAGTALLLTDRPFVGLALSAALGVLMSGSVLPCPTSCRTRPPASGSWRSPRRRTLLPWHTRGFSSGGRA